MARFIRSLALLLLVARSLSIGQTEPPLQDKLLAQAFREGPGKEEVNDPYQVLRNNPGLKAELSQAIRALEEKHGFRIRVLVRPVWMGGTVQELAGSLQDVWFPKGDGLVMVIETDNRKLGLGMAMHGDPEDETWIMPTHASAALLKRVADRVDASQPLDDFLRSVVMDMVNEHTRFLDLRGAPPEPARVLQEYLFLFGALALAGLGTLVVALCVRRSNERKKRSVRGFPAVNVPERLGAHYGGGNIAICKFGPRSS